VTLVRPCRLGCNQMRDLRRAFDVEEVHAILQHTISIGDALMLAQVLEPGFYQERLHHPAFIGSVLEHAPPVGAIATAFLRQFL
jgi:hypothetical protein